MLAFGDPRYTFRERFADAVIHGLGMIFSWAAVAVLVVLVIPTGDTLALIAATVYGAGLIAMIWFSAAYNLLHHPEWTDRLRACDHAGIFLMIAATYTPFSLVGLKGWLGLSLLALVWTVALTGILMKFLAPVHFERRAVLFYLGLGWIGLPILGKLIQALPLSTVILIAVGGVTYSVGVLFHVWEKLPFQNAIWHGFVLTAAVTHYAAVLTVLA